MCINYCALQVISIISISPFVNAFLTEAVRAGQDEVSVPIHADTTLLFVSQLLHSAWKQKVDQILIY